MASFCFPYLVFSTQVCRFPQNDCPKTTLNDQPYQLFILKSVFLIGIAEKVDNSPVKGRTSVTPTKRKDFEESDDEEEETGLLDELERSYDSQEDEDYEVGAWRPLPQANPPPFEKTLSKTSNRKNFNNSKRSTLCIISLLL